MNNVKVNKAELLEIVQANRDKHLAQYEEAFAGYQKAAIAALEDNLKRLRAGDRSRIVFMEAPPENHSKDYLRVVQMLQMSVSDEVELTVENFNNYVLDEWGWKQVWNLSNTKYLGAHAP